MALLYRSILQAALDLLMGQVEAGPGSKTEGHCH